MSNPSTGSHADFWLNKDQLKKYEKKTTNSKDNDGFTIDLIQLSAYRRVISNFVRILTCKPISVQFSDTPQEQLNFTDGNIVWLSASVRRKTDFDWSVGVALHEAAHILLSDFTVVKNAFTKNPLPVPSTLRVAAKAKKISTNQLAYLCKWTFNYVEDRYMDSYVFREAPGYRGYYGAMYNHLWNSPRMSKGLKSKAFRVPNFRSYEYRVLNLTNPDTDLDALPGLREIAETISISDIFRLKTTRERLKVGYKVAEIIINNLGDCKKEPNPGANDTIKKIHEMIGDGKPMPGDKNSDKGKGGKEQGGESESGKTEELDQENNGDTGEFSPEQVKELEKDLERQHKMLDHDYNDVKEVVSSGEKSLLDVIERYGITLVPTGRGLDKDGSKNTPSVDCIVVTKLTKELVESGSETFPMGNSYGLLSGTSGRCEDAVAKGFVLGKLLGKKLQIRGEVNVTKFIRKVSGKIERRLLAGIGAGMEDIFSRSLTQKFNRARLHISVDASGSMDSAVKWNSTMTCLTAICVAASMVDNLLVSVSFRCTHTLSDGTELPYVVLAYDSEHDKVSKIRQLFPYLHPAGCTPEGLAFEAIMDSFIVGKKTDEQDHYFLNISDGEPCYTFRSSNNKYKGSVDYSGKPASEHTKRQVEKIRAQGVKVLSYFIRSEYSEFGFGFGQQRINVSTATPIHIKDSLREQFELMYGKDAQFIDVTNVFDIAKTINRLFLTGE